MCPPCCWTTHSSRQVLALNEEHRVVVFLYRTHGSVASSDTLEVWWDLYSLDSVVTNFLLILIVKEF